MKNTSLLFPSFHPILSSYIKKIHSQNITDLPTFLFYGPQKSGKEWTTIKMIQSLNCPLFLEQNHTPIHCKTCFKINTLKSDYGIYTILSHIDKNIISYYFNVLERKVPLDYLSQEAFVHELAKIGILLEIQFIKEQNSSNKKFGAQKLQTYLEQIYELQNQFFRNESTYSISFLTKLLTELPLLEYQPSLEYTKNIIEKLKTVNIQNQYRALIIKDPAQFKNQTLLMNTLLKTVEESKNKLLIFFITHKKYKILSTIRSRSINLYFPFINNNYTQNLSDNFPLYYTDILKPSFSIPPPNYNSSDEVTLQEVLYLLEQKKLSYLFSFSPLAKAKVKQINHFILGIKEYNISIKNIKDIIELL